MLEQRMYTISLRHLSGIQKGIQSLHAVVEYSRSWGKISEKEYTQWMNKDRTVVLLEVNTHKELSEIFHSLSNFGIGVVYFAEPDLHGIITSIAFLLSERIWNEDKFPFDYINDIERQIREIKNTCRLATN